MKKPLIICAVLLVLITIVISLFVTKTVSLKIGQLENKISAHEAIIINEFSNIAENDYPLYMSLVYGTETQSYTHESIPRKITKNGEYAVKLIGLSANTTYYYRVRVIMADFRVLGNEEISFKTAEK
jgi:hypothetical protein